MITPANCELGVKVHEIVLLIGILVKLVREEYGLATSSGQ